MIYQSASRVMLVRPVVFEFNPQTSSTNVFQSKVQLSKEATYKRAIEEWEAVRKMYADNNVTTEIFESVNHNTPDAIFPNCVSTFHGNVFGQKKPVAVLHPMRDKNRQEERSETLIEFFKKLGYDVRSDLLEFEAQGLALEGTGSVVMDHLKRIAYCALSQRTDLKVAQAFAEMIGYRLVPFNTADEKGKPVYHTDLVMNINTSFAQVCTPVIAENDRKKVLDSLREGRDLMELNMRQFKAFCGNSLEVRNRHNEKLFSTSTRAFKALSAEQRSRIEAHVSGIIHAKVRMIERVGGGSDRCLTQELHGLEVVSAPVRKDSNLASTVGSKKS